MLPPRPQWVCFLVMCLMCLGACTRVDGLEGRTSEHNIQDTIQEPSLPGPNRGRLETAVQENERCLVCHDEQAREWRGSLHQRADVDPAYRQAFAIEPLPFCRGCHVPEADAQHDPPASVSELGVGCVTCHVAPDGSVWAAPSTNQGRAPHPVQRSRAFATTGGCANCHEFAFPGLAVGVRDDDGYFMQTTVREHAHSASAQAPCADCHMPIVDGRRSHAFAQVRDPEWLRKNIAVTVRKSADDFVEMTLRQTRSGHAFPTGDLFRRLEVGAELRNEHGQVLRRDVQHLARHFVERPHASGRELRGDDRLFDAAIMLDLDVAPGREMAGSLTVVHWVKLQRVATVGLGHAPREAVVESEVELDTGTFPWSP